MNRMQVMLVGDFSVAEFAPAAEAVRARAEVTLAASPVDAMAHLTLGTAPPEVIVLAWPTPGAFSTAQISRIQKAAPLARLITVLGSWCEGQRRGGIAMTGLNRTPWHQFVSRFADEFDGRRKPLAAWSMPVTTSDEDRLLRGATRRSHSAAGLIAVITHRLEEADLYGAACRQQGYSTVWLSRPEEVQRVGHATAILWDGAPERVSEISAIRRRTAAPAIALMDFPRIEDLRRAAEAGAAAVLGRPLLLDSLFWHLSQIAAPSATLSVA